MANKPKCPRCRSPMVKRSGPYGDFYGCSTYPDCRGTRQVTEVEGKSKKPGGRIKRGNERRRSDRKSKRTSKHFRHDLEDAEPVDTADRRAKFRTKDTAPKRTMRQRAHDAFDPIWKGVGGHKKQPPLLSKAAAYQWLASKLAINPSKCHIGQFDDDMCRRVINISLLYRLDRRFPKAKVARSENDADDD